MTHSNRRGGGRRGGGGAPGYNPLGSSKLIETWLSYAGTTDDGAGLISNWTGQKNGKILTAAGTRRPTLTPNLFGTRPALLFDGVANGLVCTTVGALMTGKTGITVILVLFSPATGTESFVEYATTNWFTEAGTFTIAGVATNATVTACRGNVGDSIWTTNNNTIPLVVPGVVSQNFDFTLAAAEAEPLRLDNVELGGTRSTNSNNTSTFLDRPLYVGMRGTVALFSQMRLGALAIYQTLTPEEVTYETRGLGALFGGIVVA